MTTSMHSNPVLTLERKEECRVTVGLNRPYLPSLIPTIMRSINKVILVGHVAADPEVQETKSGEQKVTFPFETHREYTSDGQKKEVTDYHRVTAWGALGETCQRYLTEGQAAYIEGSLLNRAYEKDGERRYTTEIRADEVNMLTWKRKGGIENVSVEAMQVD